MCLQKIIYKYFIVNIGKKIQCIVRIYIYIHNYLFIILIGLYIYQKNSKKILSYFYRLVLYFKLMETNWINFLNLYLFLLTKVQRARTIKDSVRIGLSRNDQSSQDGIIADWSLWDLSRYPLFSFFVWIFLFSLDFSYEKCRGW